MTARVAYDDETHLINKSFFSSFPSKDPGRAISVALTNCHSKFPDCLIVAFAANGFQALSELDSYADGEIDANDTVWASLKIWQDVDGDGFSSAEELHSLEELGVQSINTGYASSTTVDAEGNEHKQVGSFTKTDGSTGTATDVWFKRDTMFTIADEWVDVTADIAALPDLQGYGNVYDLQQAMARDTSGQLRGLIEQFMAATDPAIRNGLMDQILFTWTGSDGIDPASRGTNIDARKLAVLEKFYGESQREERRAA